MAFGGPEPPALPGHQVHAGWERTLKTLTRGRNPADGLRPIKQTPAPGADHGAQEKCSSWRQAVWPSGQEFQPLLCRPQAA